MDSWNSLANAHGGAKNVVREVPSAKIVVVIPRDKEFLERMIR